MQLKPQRQTLSFIDVLTRNLFLLTIMFIFIGVGIAVHVLNIDSLDTYFIQIKSVRLDFVFFIGVAACYVALLFILIERYWVNFFVQLITAKILFIVSIFLFSPPLIVKSYLFNQHIEFSTRTWDKVKSLPVGNMASFEWLQRPNEKDQLFPSGVACPNSYNRYFLSFVLSYYPNVPTETYQDKQGKQGIACNQATNKAMLTWSSRERALLHRDYQHFIGMDNNMANELLRNEPLVITIDKLPNELQEELIRVYGTKEAITNDAVTSKVIKRILKKK